jgi:hypothetical protein
MRYRDRNASRARRGKDVVLMGGYVSFIPGLTWIQLHVYTAATYILIPDTQNHKTPRGRARQEGKKEKMKMKAS